jgi:hypothetical protein
VAGVAPRRRRHSLSSESRHIPSSFVPYRGGGGGGGGRLPGQRIFAVRQRSRRRRRRRWQQQRQQRATPLGRELSAEGAYPLSARGSGGPLAQSLACMHRGVDLAADSPTDACVLFGPWHGCARVVSRRQRLLRRRRRRHHHRRLPGPLTPGRGLGRLSRPSRRSLADGAGGTLTAGWSRCGSCGSSTRRCRRRCRRHHHRRHRHHHRRAGPAFAIGVACVGGRRACLLCASQACVRSMCVTGVHAVSMVAAPTETEAPQTARLRRLRPHVGLGKSPRVRAGPGLERERERESERKASSDLSSLRHRTRSPPAV